MKNPIQMRPMKDDIHAKRGVVAPFRLKDHDCAEDMEEPPLSEQFWAPENRDRMVAVVKTLPSQPFQYWFKSYYLTGESPIMADVARLFGITPQSFCQNHWHPMMSRLVEEMGFGDEMVCKFQRRGQDRRMVPLVETPQPRVWTGAPAWSFHHPMKKAA